MPQVRKVICHLTISTKTGLVSCYGWCIENNSITVDSTIHSIVDYVDTDYTHINAYEVWIYLTYSKWKLKWKLIEIKKKTVCLWTNFSTNENGYLSFKT